MDFTGNAQAKPPAPPWFSSTFMDPRRQVANLPYLRCVGPWRPLKTPRTRGCVRCGCSSERQFESKLHQPRIVHGVVHHRKCARRSEVRTVPITTRSAELRMIEQVEELSPEIYTNPFVRFEVLDDRKVSVDEIRTRQRRPIRISEFPRRRLRKTSRVEPL